MEAAFPLACLPLALVAGSLLGPGAERGTPEPNAAAVLVEPAPASYVPCELFQLVLCSDLVVSGEIVALGEEDYTLRVERRIAGELPATGAGPGEIRIEQFQDWACARRSEPYAKGQQVLVFADRPEQGRTLPRILGAACEGEMRIADGIVTLSTRSLLGDVDAVPLETHRPGRSRVALDEVERCVRGLREHVDWERSDPERLYLERLRPRRSLADVEAFAASSMLARHLCFEVRTSHWIGPRTSAPRTLAPKDARWIELRRGSGASDSAPLRQPALALADVDGDGHADLVLAAPGQLRIDYLDPDGMPNSSRAASAATPELAAILGPAVEHASALAWLGDLDGDGTHEIALGSLQGKPGTWNEGHVHLVSLDGGGRISRVREITRQRALRDANPKDCPNLGRALAGLGLLRDGTLELAIGADPGRRGEGDHGRAVLVASLRADGKVVRARRIQGGDLLAFDDERTFGHALAPLGDVDGEGTCDLAIGMPDDRAPSHAPVGSVTICRSGPGDIRRRPMLIRPRHAGFLGDLDEGEDFGRALAGVEDLDGDGVPELLVGSARGVWTLFLARDGSVRGHVRIEDGPQEAADAVHFGDWLSALPRRAPGERAKVFCAGTRGSGAKAQPVVWLLELASDGTLHAR